MSENAATPRLNLGYGSGDPAGFPGYRPLNPWGRPMPKYTPKPKPELYQVFVEVMPERRMLGVGMRAPRNVLEPFCEAIKQHIAMGIEKDWRNPHIVKLLL